MNRGCIAALGFVQSDRTVRINGYVRVYKMRDKMVKSRSVALGYVLTFAAGGADYEMNLRFRVGIRVIISKLTLNGSWIIPRHANGGPNRPSLKFSS